jgi:hypothetical protein
MGLPWSMGGVLGGEAGAGVSGAGVLGAGVSGAELGAEELEAVMLGAGRITSCNCSSSPSVEDSGEPIPPGACPGVIPASP